MNELKVSVIIPTYNGSQWLASSIESALSQTYKNIEVIVVDDGSPQSTASVAEGYGGKIRYLEKKNGGTPSARNIGIKHATGDLIALLDHDDRWLPDKLSRQVPCFDDPSVGLVHSGARVIDLPTGTITSEVIPDLELDEFAILSWCKVSCATTVFRKDVIEEVGLFDENFPGADDWDMWIRIAVKGWRILAVPEALAEIYEHPNNQGKRVDRMNSIIEKLIAKHQHLNAGNAKRLAALQEASLTLREDYYVKTCRCAGEAFRQRKWGLALLLRLKAIAKHPAALTRFPMRIRQKFLSASRH